MRETFASGGNIETFYSTSSPNDVRISGGLLRGILYALSKVFLLLARQMPVSFTRPHSSRSHPRRAGHRHWHLTFGGTGKTPVVEKFAATQDQGRTVAILSPLPLQAPAARKRLVDKLLFREDSTPPALFRRPLIAPRF